MKFDKLIIFGAGAVGSNILLNVIRDLPDVEVFIVDYDKVEQRNYTAGTQPYTKNDLNKFKVQALQLIAYNQSGNRIKFFNQKINSQKDITDLIQKTQYKTGILVVDGFDNAESRNLFFNLKLKNCHVMKAGFNPNMSAAIVWEGQWEPMSEDPSLKDFDICAQQGARSFIMSFTSIASMIINDFYFEDKKKSLYFDKNYNFRIMK